MDKATSTRTDAEIFRLVSLANGFCGDDLAANRKMELSPDQQQRNQPPNPKLIVGALLVCGAFIIAAVFVRSVVTYWLAMVAAIFGAAVIYSYFKSPRDTDIVASVEGAMSRATKKAPGRSTIFYEYHVADRIFSVSRAAYDALEHEIPVRAYYLLGTEIMLNLELLGDHPMEPPMRNATPVPYTDF